LKEDVNNIEETFKKAFETFESNVDESVWQNVQQAIGVNGVNVSQPNPSVTASVGKSLITKIILGTSVLSVVVGGVYISSKNETNEIVVQEKNSAKEEVVEEKEKTFEFFKQKKTEEKAQEITEEKSSKAPVQQIKERNQEVEKDIEEEQEKIEHNTVNSKKEVANLKKEHIIEKTTQEKVVEMEVSIIADVISGESPLTVQLNAIGNAKQYFWEFSNDKKKRVNGVTIEHTFYKEGQHIIKLIALDKFANTKEVYQTITVEKNIKSTIKPIQNVITPNGDGQNDQLKIDGENIENIEVQVLDKRGKVVYIITTLEQIWDGKDKNGYDLLSGVYYLSGFAIGVDGEKHIIKQAINIYK